MYKSKRYSYSYEEYEEENKNAATMLEEILADAEFPQLEEIVIGCWGNAWDDSPQPLIDGIVERKEQFSHIKSLFIGDMDYEECEVSWIIQGDYSKLWEAMPQLKKLVIKGSTDLTLGAVQHENLEDLEIICGGLPTEIMNGVKDAKLPALKKLLLYIGVEDYGFDGNISNIKELLEHSDFPNLTYLGITDSDIQDEVAEAALNSKYIKQIETLDLSMGTLTDKGGQMLYDRLGEYPNIKNVDLHFHYLSDAMIEKLQGLSSIQFNLEEEQEADEYDGELYYYAMLTE